MSQICELKFKQFFSTIFNSDLQIDLDLKYVLLLADDYWFTIPIIKSSFEFAGEIFFKKI